MKINEEVELAVKLALLCKEQPLPSSGFKLMPNSDLKFNCEYAYPSRIAHDAARLKSMARAIGRLDEAQCNRDLTKREEMRRAKLLEAVRTLAKEYGIARVEHNSDPRGYAVYLHFPDGRGNSWGGDARGWGI